MLEIRLSVSFSLCVSFLASVGVGAVLALAAQQGVGVANDGDQGEAEAVKGS